MSKPRLGPIFVDVKEAAEALGINTARVYVLLNEGRLEGRYDKTKRLVLVRSIHEFAESLSAEPPPRKEAS